MTTQNCTIEFCTNDEWAGADICDEFGLDHGAWLKDVSNERVDAAVRAAEKAGLTVERAKGQRSLYHGWNGAQFDFRCGIFGVFGHTIEDSWTKKGAEQFELALEGADLAGKTAARAFAARIAEQNAEADREEAEAPPALES